MTVPRGLPAPFWAKVVGAFAGGLLVVWLVPRAATEGTTPPIGILLAVGLLVSIVTTGLLYAGLRFDLKLSAKAVAFAVAYNVLVVAVKFVLSPVALYQVNQTKPLGLFSVAEPMGTVFAAAVVLGLYTAGLWMTYAFARRRWSERVPTDTVYRSAARVTARVFGIGVGVLVAAAPALIVGLSGLGYVSYVFSSTYAALMGVTLAGAVALAAQAFRTTAEREALVATTATIASLFFAGLAFLALYHVLWVVYVLVLTSIWPLRVVIPK